MPDFQKEKTRVRALMADLVSGDPHAALTRHCTDRSHWRGFHPFDELTGTEAVAEVFWRPLAAALSALDWREDVFFAGRNEIDDFDSVWVVSMGHLMGLFDAPWLGIPPTGKMAFLRYAAFYRVEDDRVSETAMYVDIPHLMMQAGLHPFPPQTAAHLVQPGPATHDGLLYDDAPPTESAATLGLINRMITALGTWRNVLPLEEELRLNWAEDMIWWGPAGIGASYTIPRYIEQHSGPFRGAFADRAKTGHIARLAEGHYGGFFGYPNFTVRPVGGLLGMPATETRGAFRVIDIYRREGDLLKENWVFIDMLHFFKTQGVDILSRCLGEAAA